MSKRLIKRVPVPISEHGRGLKEVRQNAIHFVTSWSQKLEKASKAYFHFTELKSASTAGGMQAVTEHVKSKCLYF